ncbi:two-component sensor histidine kinase [Pseudomonas sp. FW306-1C-G01A]|jgi:signal transduction histidine kinase|uniref:histidine kinase n=1 Tax=Pseudomonas mandelii TaxID=75612 RepID=A0ABY0VZ05_9PSED|nr:MULTISPECIES: ATP-binding protein [Pseudomonas]MBU0526517.1 two-component sensor histidine kinase [Gammaproteobacteria bacterium]MBU0819066.1 two-component sensor histidine kinase [Gammaproteobacteria bacterium]MBU0844774.1 two-component sensor histidine kinase [Gammaproteobacteria bacterium]MBU1842085.1 two-component sensor histidine kinase [Gammaproteobacteria bacterium]MDO8712212.1 ATP-binding protein [Pseudomonas sp.]
MTSQTTTLLKEEGDIRLSSRKQPFNLLRWFSLISMAVIGTVAVALGAVSTRFVITESVQRDALLTSQFIQAIASAEVRHVSIPNVRTMGELLDPRKDRDFPDVDPMARASARGEFLDHIQHLPDVILANIYAPDRMVIWSTNPALMGTTIHADEDLDQAFASKTPVSASYHNVDKSRMEQKFITPPDYIFIENYIPLFDADGNTVTAMVEIYKEPRDLIDRMERGLVLIWLATALGGGLIYLGLYWIVRRAAILLAVQQKQLITNETFVALGEMSSAVAHSLRNPLATIRSSAELALEFDTGLAHKNINDIIGQVDRMSKWVRELLQSLRPLNDDAEPVNLVAALHDSLMAFEHQIAKAGVQVVFEPQETPMVLSQQVQLTQILNSLLANAVEAMDRGGTLSITLESTDTRGICVVVSDTGKGMNEEQRRMAFRPFFTTKQGGLGVGLVLVKRIMERFGGAVNLGSREGEGTSVRLSFKRIP